MDRAALVSQLSPPLDKTLAEALIAEFLDLERRYALGDWEPATLDGGQLAEIASRIIYHLDSGNLNPRKSVDACLRFIEDPSNSNPHSFPVRRSALHLAKVLRTLYKFRSQRGAIHIDPDYSANELDAGLVLGLARWILSEVLRLFWNGATSDVARVVREIVRYHVPAVLVIDDRPLVLRTDGTVQEEILLLLHNAGEAGMSRSDLGAAIPKAAPTISTALSRLVAPGLRQALRKADGNYILTPNGVRRVKEDLGSKLGLE